MGRCGAAVRALARGSAALLGAPGTPRALALASAALVGLGPVLRARADPHSVLGSPHNLLEARLVSSAGGWTSLLLVALAVAALPLLRPPGGAVLRGVARWAVGVAWARSAPSLFRALEEATGRCWSPLIGGGVLLPPHGEPISCRGAGHRWEGFGPSPQAFALVHCGLGLAEETQPYGWEEEEAPEEAPEEGPGEPGTALSLLFLLNVGLVVLWQLLLAVTLAYRHDWPRNAAGAALGWAAWAITYRFWYRCPWSPGPPGLGPRVA
ncbi:fat storage-inducing transmembrane protein 1-like [Aegotheles albertisi]